MMISPELAAKLSEPIFDPTTKSTHDVPINRDDCHYTELSYI